MARNGAWDRFSLFSEGEEVAHVYGKMARIDRKLGRRTGRHVGDQKQCVMEGE